MTAPGLYLDDIVTWGLVALFLGLVIDVAIGLAVGRWKGSEIGAGSGMMLLGIRGLAFAGWIACFVFVESTTVVLPRSGCEPMAASADGEPRSYDVFMLPRAGQSAARLVTPTQNRACPEQEEPPSRLRIRRDELAAAGTGVRAAVVAEREEDKRHPIGVMGVFIAFGGFGLLGGLALLASSASRSPAAVPGRNQHKPGKQKPAKQHPTAKATPQRPLHPQVKALAEAIAIAGTLAAFGGFIAAGVVDDTARSFHFALNGPALACACYFVSFALQRKLSLAGAAILTMVGGGFALAAAAVKFFA